MSIKFGDKINDCEKMEMVVRILLLGLESEIPWVIVY